MSNSRNGAAHGQNDTSAGSGTASSLRDFAGAGRWATWKYSGGLLPTRLTSSSENI